MARPQKAGVDYFSHDVDTDGKTLFTLEATYGNDGYAFWFKLLELLGKQDGLYYDCREEANIIYLAARAHISVERAIEMLDILAKLGAIDAELWQQRLIWCQKFVNRLQDVYAKRRRELPQRPSLGGENVGFRDENGAQEDAPQQVDAQTPQRKVNHNKVNESNKEESGSAEPLSEDGRAAISLPLGRGGMHDIAQRQLQDWRQLYPQVDILLELRKMKRWLAANPRRCQSEAALERFITGWLAREQEQKTSPQPGDLHKNSRRGNSTAPADKPRGKYAEIYDKY